MGEYTSQDNIDRAAENELKDLQKSFGIFIGL
jgi:hypothetical protein